MSWLDKKIKNVLNKTTEAHIDAALAQMMQEVLAEYQGRLDNGELRVHDEQSEGILYGLRENTFTDPETNIFQLSCDALTVQRGREEAFSRALFNQKSLNLQNTQVNLISYEAPLLRKREKRGGGICKLDLIGLGLNTLWAIEYKQRCSAATSSRYGVLEALTYGALLAKHLHDSPDGMNSQIQLCVDNRGPFDGAPIAFAANAASVKYSVAGPWAFFQDDTRTDRRIGLTAQFTEAARRYAAAFSLKTGVTLEFGGFIMVGDENTTADNQHIAGGKVVRTFHPPALHVPVLNSITEVHEFVND